MSWRRLMGVAKQTHLSKGKPHWGKRTPQIVATLGQGGDEEDE